MNVQIGQNQSEFNGLDTELDPPQRCSTSFFTLLSGVAVDATLLQAGDLSEADDDRGGTLRLWANRPGQNGVEAVTLAFLSFWLTSGIATGLIIELLDERWWSWPIALAAAPIASFVMLHLFTAVVALFGTGLHSLGIAGRKKSSSLTSFLSLAGLTAIAAAALNSNQWLLIAAGGPWLLWTALNLFAWAILLARNLYRSLGHLS